MAYIRMIIGVLIAIGVLAGISVCVQAQSDEGLVAEWHFDEGAGSVVEDSSGNGNDGVIYGATWVEGKYGGALSFDGVDDYVDSGNPSDLSFGNGDFTIYLCIKPADFHNYQRFMTKYISTPHGWIIYGDSYGNVLANVIGTGATAYNIPMGTYETNIWHSYAIVKTSNQIKTYMDGNLVHTSNIHVGDTDTSTNLLFGKYGATYLKGLLDEVSIYKRALTAEEIKEHYEGRQTALSLTKSAAPHSIKKGQTTTVTIVIENTGTDEITDIELSDTIPSDLTFVSGETSKTYASLRPKDSREIQYSLQLNEAGTFNLDPATAMYADENGNYHTVTSKTVAIEVKPSLIETANQIQMTTGNDAQSASVHLHGEKTDVIMGEDILLKLAAVNLITKPTMHVQVIITPPSGISVTSSEFVQSGAGLFTASYEIEPGVGRDIEVKMRSNQVGDFVVNGRIVYYFGDDMDGAEDHTLTLPITVRSEAEAGAGAEQTTGTSGSDGSSTPGFAAVVAVIGILLAYRRK